MEGVVREVTQETTFLCNCLHGLFENINTNGLISIPLPRLQGKLWQGMFVKSRVLATSGQKSHILLKIVDNVSLWVRVTINLHISLPCGFFLEHRLPWFVFLCKSSQKRRNFTPSESVCTDSCESNPGVCKSLCSFPPQSMRWRPNKKSIVSCSWSRFDVPRTPLAHSSSSWATLIGLDNFLLPNLRAALSFIRLSKVNLSGKKSSPSISFQCRPVHLRWNWM